MHGSVHDGVFSCMDHCIHSDIIIAMINDHSHYSFSHRV